MTTIAPVRELNTYRHEEKDDSSKMQPFFVTFNRYYEHPFNQFSYDPFPAEQFPPHSPWEDHVVVAHHGVAKEAASLGMTPEQLILSKIRQAAIGS